MAAKAVQVSIEEELLQRIDDDPETHEKGRSAFIRSAVEQYLRMKERRNIDEAIRAAYAGRAGAMAAEIAELMPTQSWPKD